ncbi:hypothetical protein BaRGS_00038920 [Batillaria attramentaria]|uniref:Sulfotransferase domain-containing protein n=1 Tax=Batillaria attramentaria TaxID=370345 RepID=A0ABD0J4N1_9CAEN
MQLRWRRALPILTFAAILSVLLTVQLRVPWVQHVSSTSGLRNDSDKSASLEKAIAGGHKTMPSLAGSRNWQFPNAELELGSSATVPDNKTDIRGSVQEIRAVMASAHGSLKGTDTRTEKHVSSNKSTDFLFPPCTGPENPDVRPKLSAGFVGPFPYLANYKNPCWLEKSAFRAPKGRVRCVPYFYIAGCPKCGSTDLFYRITQHPQMASPSTKETRWFDRARFEGDGSPTHFFENRYWPLMPGNERCREPRVTVASYIHHLYPQARIIFILRNPVDRMYSGYLYNQYQAKVAPVNNRNFHRFVQETIPVYKDCFEKHSLRVCVNNVTLLKNAKIPLKVGLYEIFVRDWLQLFPREHILFLTTDNYQQYPKATLKRVFQFLGLRPLTDSHLHRIFTMDAKVHNSGTMRYQRAGPLLPATRKLLEDFYRAYNQQLAALLNDTDFLWPAADGSGVGGEIKQ